MAGVRKITIADLGPGISDAMIIAIIIAKQSPRVIPNKKNPGTERGVWSFTLRDSAYDFINATYWGSVDSVNNLANGLHVGDIVEVINAKINMRQPGDSDERFHPSVTSPFQLSLSENHSSVQLQRPVDEFDSQQYNNLIQLLRIPTKAPSFFLTIADVLANGTSMQGEFVDLLVAVARVGSVRTIKTKDGREIECREVVVMDQTSSNLSIQLWEPDLIIQAGNWRPRDTILFLADMRLAWNDFHKSVSANFSSRTVVTENPETTEANILRKYACTAPIAAVAVLDHIANSISDASTIRTVMSVHQVIKKAWGNDSQAEGQPIHSDIPDDSHFTCLVYSFVTELDLDGVTRVILKRCSKCQSTLEDSAEGICNNMICPVGSGADFSPPETIFSIRVTLSDHTASLSGCRLIDKNAEKVLGCTVSRFINLTSEEKTSLKWRLLLERCAARILVLKVTPQRRTPLFSLLSCEPADPAVVAARCPRF